MPIHHKPQSKKKLLNPVINTSVFFQNHPTILQVKNQQQYVEASNFRQNTATTENVTEVTIPVNPLPAPPTTPFAFQPEGLGQEFDKAYFATLDAFVHDF